MGREKTEPAPPEHREEGKKGYPLSGLPPNTQPLDPAVDSVSALQHAAGRSRTLTGKCSSQCRNYNSHQAAGTAHWWPRPAPARRRLSCKARLSGLHAASGRTVGALFPLCARLALRELSLAARVPPRLSAPDFLGGPDPAPREALCRGRPPHTKSSALC